MDAPLLHSLSVFAYAIALAPAIAHAAVMHRKLPMSSDDYFLVQRLYAGWMLFGLAEIAAVVATLLLTIEQSGTSRFVPALVALLAALGALAVFFATVLPANKATMDWNTVTDNWERLRRRWEYGHLLRCLMLLAGLVFLLFAR